LRPERPARLPHARAVAGPGREPALPDDPRAGDDGFPRRDPRRRPRAADAAADRRARRAGPGGRAPGGRGRRGDGGGRTGQAPAANPEGTVLIDGGDLFQGPMISNLQFGRPVVEQMNLLNYTAAAVGNHEFDWGVDTLARRVREMKFADMAANMVEKKTGKRP